MVNKNLTEISVIEQSLPNVVIEICLFHALKAVKIKISKMNMRFKANVSAKNYMQKLAYSQTYEQFLDNYNRMINDVNLKDTDFITYFDNNWLGIRAMWCAEFRNQGCVLRKHLGVGLILGLVPIQNPVIRNDLKQYHL